MTTLFDRYLAVDWSASASPKRGSDSIWIADCSVADCSVDGVSLANPPTRQLAAQRLSDRLIGSPDERILVGVDACLGYPVGTAELFGLSGTPWRAMWQQIVAWMTDDERNRNNRFDVAARFNDRSALGEGPFWGAPDMTRAPSLMRTKPRGEVPGGPAEFRASEQRFRRAGSFPKSVWQLLGAGSVGSQTLTLIPVIEQLVGALGGRGEVWPFAAGFEACHRPAAVVFAEVWPSVFMADRPEAETGMVKDAEQVIAVARAMRSADEDGSLESWFTPPVTAAERTAAVAEEGWVFGPPEGLPANLPGAV